jgi:aminopeptidase N
VSVRPDIAAHTLQGSTRISFTVLHEARRMQLDLQVPLEADNITWDAHGVQLPFEREGNVLWVRFPDSLNAGSHQSITVKYHGAPREARNPPWDGGWIWKTDAEGRPWVSVACQGLGASVWYPCKDHQSDEPDSAALHITVPDSLQAVGNGRFKGRVADGKGMATWSWSVRSPINTYNLVPYIGRYVEIHDRYMGETGPLDIQFFALADNEAKAREQIKQVRSMLKCFEHWFGPYPFQADGYKLVEAPHLGMEHQSAIAYGNHYLNGYLGQDLSGSGWGLQWDYIIVHESAHEWWGNNITTADIADMWVHEGFADYAETIYTECISGKEAGADYLVGLRRHIANDRPVIGPYGVNREGSGDMYYKGANLIHTIRQVVGDDARFREVLRGLNMHFRHSVVTSAEVEAWISRETGRDLSKVFDQYLRTTQVPRFEYRITRKRLSYRWSECVPDFDLPVLVRIDGVEHRLEPTPEWHTLDGTVGKRAKVEVDRNWYVTARKVH